MFCQEYGTPPMCHTCLGTANFWMLLLRIDEDIAAQVRAAGCPVCAGPLYSANYPRKPRGIPWELLGEAYAQRLSLCCDRDGCRQRCTPPSVRFLGRRVFLGAVMVLVTTLAAGLPLRRVAALCAQFRVSVRTLRRWRGWWQQAFVASARWRQIRARLVPPVAADGLPGALLQRCAVADDAERLRHLLCLLAPLSTTSCVMEVC